MVSAAVLLVSSRTQAVPLPAPLSSFRTAIHDASGAQEVSTVCRRGSHGRRCYDVSRPHRRLGYDRGSLHQPRPYAGDSHYSPFYYGNPQGSD